jgi:hypothetical protein
VTLSPEFRQRLYEEERIRAEAQTRIREEIRLREQRTALIIRVVMVIVFFSVGYYISDHYLRQSQAVPQVGLPIQSQTLQVGDQVLDEIAAALKPDVEGDVCVVALDRPRLQVRVTMDLSREVPRETARRLATAGATRAGATLRKNGLAIPAQVEVFSPKRWVGTAVYDSDTLKISWDNCPGRCEEEAARPARKCRG